MYVAASQEVQFDDVELYVTVFFSRNVEQWISSYGRKIIKRPFFFFFCKSTLEKLIQVESPCNQTPLNYANPHAQVIVSSLHHLSPSHSSFPMRTAKDKGSLAGSCFDILKKLVPFLFEC